MPKSEDFRVPETRTQNSRGLRTHAFRQQVLDIALQVFQLFNARLNRIRQPQCEPVQAGFQSGSQVAGQGPEAGFVSQGIDKPRPGIPNTGRGLIEGNRHPAKEQGNLFAAISDGLHKCLGRQTTLDHKPAQSANAPTRIVKMTTGDAQQNRRVLNERVELLRADNATRHRLCELDNRTTSVLRGSPRYR